MLPALVLVGPQPFRAPTGAGPVCPASPQEAATKTRFLVEVGALWARLVRNPRSAVAARLWAMPPGRLLQGSVPRRCPGSVLFARLSGRCLSISLSIRCCGAWKRVVDGRGGLRSWTAPARSWGSGRGGSIGCCDWMAPAAPLASARGAEGRRSRRRGRTHSAARVGSPFRDVLLSIRVLPACVAIASRAAHELRGALAVRPSRARDAGSERMASLERF